MHQLAKSLIELHKLELQSASSAISSNTSRAKSPRRGSNLTGQLHAAASAGNNPSLSPLDEAIQLFEGATDVAKEVLLITNSISFSSSIAFSSFV
jgi:hypothetical protein